MSRTKREAKRAKHEAKRAAKALKKSRKTILNTVAGVIANFDDKAFKELGKEKMDALKDYLDPMHECATYGLTLERGEGDKPNIVWISPKLRMEKELGDEITKICPSEKGIFLHHRSWRGVGLNEDESFEVRFQDNGELIGKVYRNVLTEEESLAALEFMECHRRDSDGWNRGCQADALPRLNRINQQLYLERPMNATRINRNNTLVSIEPGGKGRTTGPKAIYKLPKTGKIAKVPLSSWVDRAKFVPGRRKDSRGISLDDFLDDGTQALRDLHSKLVDIYAKECCEMKYTEEVIETDIKKSICINTNIIDDKESVMAIHHDPSTKLPALICGPSNFEYVDGEWKLKQRGGRLFAAESMFNLEYRPRDVVILNGNVPHGISKMRPVRNVDGSYSSTDDFNRFSIVLFSRFERFNMRSHGWHRRV